MFMGCHQQILLIGRSTKVSEVTSSTHEKDKFRYRNAQ